MLPFSMISQVTGINNVQHVHEYTPGRNIDYFQTAQLVIKNPDSAPLHIDGDPVDTHTGIQNKNYQKLLQAHSACHAVRCSGQLL